MRIIYDRSAAHGAQWQNLELKFRQLLQQKQALEMRKSCVCVT